MESGYANTQEFGQIHYRQAGEGDAVLFLHKTPSSSIQYVRTMPYFAEAGFRAIAMDTLGNGASTPPPAAPPMEHYGRAVHALLDELGVERAFLVGHHTGASIALEALNQDEQRFRKAVFAGILAFEDDADRAPWANYLEHYQFELDSKGDFLARYPQPMLHEWLTEDDPEQYWLELIAYLQAGPSFWWTYNAVFTHQPYEIFPRLELPVLFLNQEQGRTYDSTKKAFGRVRGAEYVEVPGTSEGTMDDPETFARTVVGFLRK